MQEVKTTLSLVEQDIHSPSYIFLGTFKSKSLFLLR